jgi:hypothetical protein
MRVIFCVLIFLFCLNIQAQICNPISCEWELNLTDEFSGKKKMQLKARKFFGYNPEGSSRFFIGQEYLECKAALAKMDDKMLLNMNIIIQDKEIAEIMGDIAPNSSIELTSIKGKTLFLKTFVGAKAALKDKNTLYNCSYFISKSNLKKLKDFEIDTVKINWSKAFQVYTVYYLDCLSDQIKCFE